MFNPFVPFTTEILNAFVRAGKTYFVRQTFPRGLSNLETNIKGAFLYTHYSEMPAALTHFGSLKNDPHRFTFDWQNEDHKIRLLKAANGIEGYRIFANLLYDDTDKRVPVKLQQYIRGYLQYKMKWYPSRADGVDSHFYTHLGELYTALKFRTKEVRVPLIEIEKFKL